MRKLGYISAFVSIRIPVFSLCKFEIKYHLHNFEKCLPEYNILLLQGNVLHLYLQMQQSLIFLFQLSESIVDIFNQVNLLLIFYCQICKDLKCCLYRPHMIMSTVEATS